MKTDEQIAAAVPGVTAEQVAGVRALNAAHPPIANVEQILRRALNENPAGEVTVTFDCYSHARGEYAMTLTAPVVAVDGEALTLDAADEDGHEARIEWDRITAGRMALGRGDEYTASDAAADAAYDEWHREAHEHDDLDLLRDEREPFEADDEDER